MCFDFAKVAVITPHADDETLGCGGTLIKFRDKMETLHIALCCASTIKHRNNVEVSDLERLAEFECVAKKLGAVAVCFGYEDRKAYNAHAEIIESVDKWLDVVKPTMLFAPYTSFHQDHRTVYEAIHAALRPGRHPSINTVLLYETGEYGWFVETELFVPNIYVELTQEHLNRKLTLLELYKSQERAGVRAAVNYAAKRGTEMGATYAEGFRVARVTM